MKSKINCEKNDAIELRFPFALIRTYTLLNASMFNRTYALKRTYSPRGRLVFSQFFIFAKISKILKVFIFPPVH